MPRTFVTFIHQPDKVMQTRMLALLCFFQFFIACQQGQQNLPVSEAGMNSSLNPKLPETSKNATASKIVFQSSDGGQTWQDVSDGLPKNLGISCIFAAGGKIFLGSESGLYHTSTGASTPAWENEFFLNRMISDIFPGSTGLYTSSYDNGIYKEVPGSNVWIPMHHNLPDKSVMTVLETAEGLLFVGCESGIYKSGNGGINWELVYSKGPVVSIVISNGILVAGGPKGLLRSSDQGANWSAVSDEDGGFRKTGIMRDGFFAISIGKPLVGDMKTRENHMIVSTDGGLTWRRTDEGLAPLRFVYDDDKKLSSVQYINDAEQIGNDLFCSLDAGIYRSTDQGKTWTLVLPSAAKTSYNLAVSGKMLYAVVAGGC